MGGMANPAPFAPLVTLASHLIRSQYTSSINKAVQDGEPLPATFETFKDEKEPTHERTLLKEKFELPQEAFDFFTNNEIFKDVFSHNFAIEHFGKALAHLCFNNYKFSKRIC